MILEFLLESSGAAGCHELRKKSDALTKAFLRGDFLVEAVVRNLNFSILMQLSGPVKRISV